MDGMWVFTVGLIIYLGVLIWIGLRERAGSKSERGFYLAGRSLGSGSVAASLAATSIGGSAVILVIGMVYQSGLPFIWTDLAGGLGLILLALVLAGKVRETGVYSLPELAGKMYGPTIRRLSALIVLIAEIGFLALLLRGSAGLLEPIWGLPDIMNYMVVGGIFVLYTSIGGQTAVVKTDILQLILMVAGLGILVLFAVLAVQPDVWSATPTDHFSFPTSSSYPPLSVLTLALIAGLPHLVGSDIYAKVLCARDARAARRGAAIAGVLKILVGIVAGIIGLSAAALLPAGLPQASVLSELFDTVLPAWAAAPALLALLATLMSSADSVLMTAATVFTRDILALRGNLAVSIGRLASACIGLAAIALSLLLGSMLSLFLFAYTLFSASLVLPLLAGFWKNQLGITPAAVFASMAGGAVMVLTARALGWDTDAITLSGLAVCGSLLFVVSFIHRSVTRRTADS